jgi:ABC-type multidrug transport system ATPase subunit
MTDPNLLPSDSPKAPPALRFEGIRKVYSDGTVALDGVDLEVREGMVGLLGPNGAGKTTLLSILTLAQQPTSGLRDYFGLGDDPRQWSEIRRRIGYLPQVYRPVHKLSGAEYLSYCAALRAVPLGRRAMRQRVADLLDAVELSGAAHRHADTYSGGMIRRLGLAQALIHAPSLLVVDEPTAGLDPEERIRFRNLVTELADRIPVLLSTHIVEDIEATCPRLAILGHGTKLYDGPPTDLMRRVQGSLWRRADCGEPVPGERKIGRRVDENGSAWAIVHVGSAPSGLEPVTPTLEEACSTFLALHGEGTLDTAEDDAGRDTAQEETA